MNLNKSFAIISLFLLTGCLSTIKPAKQIDDNQKIIAKEEKKVDNTLVEIEKNDKGKRIQTSGLSVGIQHSLNQVSILVRAAFQSLGPQNLQGQGLIYHSFQRC